MRYTEAGFCLKNISVLSFFWKQTLPLFARKCLYLRSIISLTENSRLTYSLVTSLLRSRSLILWGLLCIHWALFFGDFKCFSCFGFQPFCYNLPECDCLSINPAWSSLIFRASEFTVFVYCLFVCLFLTWNIFDSFSSMMIYASNSLHLPPSPSTEERVGPLVVFCLSSSGNFYSLIIDPSFAERIN